MALIKAGLGDAAAETLNGSDQYAPALLALIVFSVFLSLRRHPQAKWIVAATGVFAASLVVRTLDPHLCDQVPRGTHFLWHILNATVIGLLLTALIQGIAARQGALMLDATGPDR
jgi:hypothetical protein